MWQSRRLAIGVSCLVWAAFSGSAVHPAVAGDDIFAPPFSLAAADPTGSSGVPRSTTQTLSGLDRLQPSGVHDGPRAAGNEPITSQTRVGLPIAGPPTSTSSESLRASILRQDKKTIHRFAQVGADYPTGGGYMRNLAESSRNAIDYEPNWPRRRARTWSTISLGDFSDFNNRVVWEGYHWFPLGNKSLVLNGTAYDGSRTIYFDAIRLTLDLDATR